MKNSENTKRFSTKLHFFCGKNIPAQPAQKYDVETWRCRYCDHVSNLNKP